jgi:tetratricopeptide (TPR) repeat protein
VGAYRYKAFISYSHQDRKWAAWLQRALEGYRIPKWLAGREGAFGTVPRRLSPVFRDREDLSSASDLSVQVREALDASEALVVLCSPSAARSAWVNEEIRYFQSQGRGERIYALIVAGDPQSDDPAQQCFPPALTVAADGSPREPLAADARKWADGRLLAKLKIISGILGINLDDLRRRDMQRRHRLWLLSTGGALIIAVAMVVLALMAIKARYAAENRREHAEELVGYMVDDLRSKLDEVGRLDILEGMGGEVSDYLQTLDPEEVTDESLAQQAKVWRQLGEVSMDQGDLQAAMQSFTGSRDVLVELYRRDPSNPEWLFQLGNAAFWIGYVHTETGAFDEARRAFERYMQYATQLADLDPGNPEWLMEKGYAHTNLAGLVVRDTSGDVESALEHIQAAVDIVKQVLVLDPANESRRSEYGEALAWLADTRMLICDLAGALTARQENVEIANAQLQAAPGNVNFKARYAYSLGGLAQVERQLGLVDQAIAHFEESTDLLEQLSAADRSNLYFQWEALWREAQLAELQAEKGQSEAAQERLASLYRDMQALLGSESQQSAQRLIQWQHYLLEYSDVASRTGLRELASRLLDEAMAELQRGIETGNSPDAFRNNLMAARFLYWERTGADLAQQPGFVRIDFGLEDEKRSCIDHVQRVRLALLAGDRAAAQGLTSQLLSRGYFEPSFVRTCRRYGLCQPLR